MVKILPGRLFSLREPLFAVAESYDTANREFDEHHE
jgi:hypothetical protein